MIVDVQKGFINGETEHVVPRVEQLQAEYEHVYATPFVNREGSPYRKFLGWGRFTQGSEDMLLAFEPLPSVRVIVKNLYSSLNNNLLDELESNGNEEVHLFGIDTDACVSVTAVAEPTRFRWWSVLRRTP